MLDEIVIALESEPSEDARGAILEGLRGYNRQHIPSPEFQPLVLAVRHADTIIGGLVGQTGWGWMHVDLLWLAEGYRGQGLGRCLLQTAENEARLRGVRQVYLDTFDFQARPFYERVGYVVFGELQDFPPGHKRFFLRKELIPPHPLS